MARRLALPTGAAGCAALVAAWSPWQIFMSRIALPPALVPLCWALCMVAALLLIQRGGRREAWLLALAAGIGLYAYPTMKMAVPLLVGWAVLLAGLRHGWGALRQWLPAALLLAVLWLPFGYITLFNEASSTRLDQAAIQANSVQEWFATWWNNYWVYFTPSFYLETGDGSSIRSVPNQGIELAVGFTLAVLGLAPLVWRCVAPLWRQSMAKRVEHAAQWWFVAGALLLAPLPASLTDPSPHVYRAAALAPMYALLVGLGMALVFQTLARVFRRALQVGAARIVVGVFVVALGWQALAWFRVYMQEYPAAQAWENQDGLLEAMQRAVRYAPAYDEVWVLDQRMNEPYIYLLLAQPMPPRESQAQISVIRAPDQFNFVTGIGKYRFIDKANVPATLPTIEAIPDRFGGAAFVLQTWRYNSKKLLIVRRMEDTSDHDQ